MKKSLEEKLIICCASANLDEEKTDEIRRLLDIDLDWDYILRNRPFAGISPLLFYNLRRIAGKNTIPQPVMDRLRASYAFILRRNMHIYAQLREALEELGNAGIPVMLLKGVALAETVYPDMALRPMSDIDILVKKTDLRNAARLFSKLGYISIGSAESRREHHHIAPFLKLHSSIAIEVHHNIAPEPLMSRINIDRLWGNPQVVNVAGMDVLALSPEDLILHLCVHFSYSFRIRVMVDIAQSIRYYGESLNWQAIVGRSNEFMIGNCIYYPLCLAKEMLGFTIPTYALNGLNLEPELKPYEAKILDMMIRRIIFADLEFSQDLSLFFWHFISFVYESTSRELLHTLGFRNRIANLGSKYTHAFTNAFHRYIKK